MLTATLQITREERPRMPGQSSQGKLRVEQLLSKDLSNMHEFRSSSRVGGKEPAPHILSRNTERVGQVSQFSKEPLLCKSGLLQFFRVISQAVLTSPEGRIHFIPGGEN